jgi:hypothetical protein
MNKVGKNLTKKRVKCKENISKNHEKAKKISRRKRTHVNEGVHDGHGLGGDTGIRVHLFEDLVDVDLVGLGL